MKYRIKETTTFDYIDNGSEEGEERIFTRFWPQYRYPFWPFWFSYMTWECDDHYGNLRIKARFRLKGDAEQFIRDAIRKERLEKKFRREVKYHSFGP